MIPEFNKNEIDQLRDLLESPKRIVITTHYKPDGDAMGSSLALYLWLESRGHDVTVITPSDYPDFLYWMPGNDKVVNFERNYSIAKQITAAADIIFCLDFNTASRTEKFSEYISRSEAIKILIDHHLDPEPFCDYTFSFPTACATCELIYYFIVSVDSSKAVTKSVAECLYAGIMTDTGSFRFASMTADTHRIVADLMQKGVSNFYIHEKVYDNFSIDRTRFLGYCITAYISVTKEELKEYNHHSGDTEGIVNYALGIKDIRFAAFFCERDNLIKISFRSKDEFSVKDLAREHFSGGGHKNAAGGRSTDSLQATIDRFLSLLPGLKNDLSK